MSFRTLILTIGLLAACKGKEAMEPDPDFGTPEFRISDFTAPEECGNCHPNHYREWQGSMHAYAFTDPVFFAMHDRGQQETSGALDQFCVKCHSPIASRTGETPPFFERSALSTISTRGVQCDVCHTLTKVNNISNADFEMNPGDTKYGPLADPQPNSFHESEFNSLFDRSEFCGTCHEVENDLGTKIEETYSEWVNASLAGMSFDCQDCHMPTYSGQAAVDGPQRAKLHRHDFVGVDVALVDFPNSEEQRRMSEELLKSAATLTVSHPATATAGDTVTLEVAIENIRAGHSLPSGVTAERQMWVALIARDGNDAILYESGQLDNQGDLMDHHSASNPDGDPDLVVFRQIMKDENGEEVLFFWQAKTVENNLIPLFSSRTLTYDLVIPRDYTGEISLDVRLRFRALPPYFLRELGLNELIAQVPIVDMAQFSGKIDVKT